jgi:endonuclease/exonuclease/phosphatase family metal-dependent hydrolase
MVHSDFGDRISDLSLPIFGWTEWLGLLFSGETQTTMPAFPKPSFAYTFNTADEIKAVRDYRKIPGRAIPDKSSTTLLLATWNIANLGLQQREPGAYKIIAEMLSWFDLIAVQEVNDNLAGLRAIQAELPNKYRALFSDAAGNNERLAYLYDSTKVTLLEKVGEIAPDPVELKFVKLPGVTQKFEGFDRNPYIASFQAGAFRFQLVNVHLYFGDDSKAASIERRSLEAYAVARWADLRSKSKYAYAKDIIALGDFNLPKTQAGDPIYTALTKRGLELPQHSSEVGSSIASDNHYDQLAFYTDETQADFTGKTGIFDYDGALFRKLWDTHTRVQFMAYMRYHISDHRILWSEFKI